MFQIHRPSRALGFAAALISMFLSGCAGTEEKSELLSLLGVDEKIVEGGNQAADNTYDAITLLKRGEAYFVKGEYIEAVAEFERFLSLHPFHRMAAFSQYKVAMSYYHQINSIDRDPAPMEKALTSFQKVVSQFPQSLYVEEAQERINELRQRQDRHQFQIGRFYFRTKAYPAAIARFEKILAQTQDGRLTEETLFFLGMAYLRQGDKDRSFSTFQVLLEKYPASGFAPNIRKLHPQLKVSSAAS